MVPQDSDKRLFCYACRLLRAEFGEPWPDGPCPKCGNTALVAHRPGEEFNITAGGITIQSRPPGGGRWEAKSEIKHSHFKKTGRNHFVERVIDRIQNKYYERIVDTETGEVVRFIDEPLSDHQGHGSAKKKSPER